MTKPELHPDLKLNASESQKDAVQKASVVRELLSMNRSQRRYRGVKHTSAELQTMLASLERHAA